MSPRSLWTHTEALLLDFDGVLADSEPVFRSTWNQVLKPHETVSEEVYWHRWSFQGEGDLFLEERGYSAEERKERKARQRELYARECRLGSVLPLPGALSLLEWTLSRRPCAIASNTDSGLLREILLQWGAPEIPLVGGEGLRHKPFPDIFLRASEFLGVPPEKCLVIEDAGKGIRAAKSGGFPCILVRNPRNQAFEAPADAEIYGLDALLAAWRDGTP